MDLVELAQEYIKKHFKEPFALTTPVFFRRLQDDFIEFYDPVYDRFMRMKVWDLYDYLEGYQCSNCGRYHVPGAIDMTDPKQPKHLFFSEFLDMLKREMGGA
jgi:hypothetical protein